MAIISCGYRESIMVDHENIKEREEKKTWVMCLFRLNARKDVRKIKHRIYCKSMTKKNQDVLFCSFVR